MREIKFRLWTNRDKCFCGAFDVYKSGLVRESPNNEWIDLSKQNDLVLMQYTGLKDKNNEEIYDGDIVESKKKGVDSYYGIGKVEWAATGWSIPGIGTNYLEVVGNIYENPELLTP